MWTVRLALRRPYTSVVMALLITVMGGLSLLRMPVDIFPKINIPVISVIWSYGALSPNEMQERITTIVPAVQRRRCPRTDAQPRQRRTVGAGDQ